MSETKGGDLSVRAWLRVRTLNLKRSREIRKQSRNLNVKHMIFMYELNANKNVTYFYVAPISFRSHTRAFREDDANVKSVLYV